MAFIKERAERDKREKEALEALRMNLENEKRKVEVDLEAERNLALDKDTQLERSKQNELELQEALADLRQDVLNMQEDLEMQDSQLDRQLANHKAAEEKYEAMRQAFDEAAAHLVRLESEQREWTSKEAQYVEAVDAAQMKLDALTSERDDLLKSSEDTRRSLTEREEDLVRARERMDITITELEAKLASETRNR